MDGILNINKPSGWTSFDVVAKVRRLSGEKRVGHGGTLDPLATGVLPVFLGQATRFIEFTARHTKSYQAVVRLGVTTDTYDSTGATTLKLWGLGQCVRSTPCPHDVVLVAPMPLMSALATVRGSKHRRLRRPVVSCERIAQRSAPDAQAEFFDGPTGQSTSRFQVPDDTCIAVL
jgi:hypothetical protein